MAISTGARAQIGLVQETTWGVIPASPALTGLPFTSFNVNLTKQEYEDASIQADRMEHFSVSGNRSVGGDIAVNFAAGLYDGLLESLMSNAFTTNVLKVGSARKSFTFEHSQLDIGVFTAYTGIIVDKFALNVPNNGIVGATFTLMGKDATAPAASSVDASGYTPAVVATPMTHLGGTFSEGGSASGIITSIQVNVDNGYSANYSLGNAAARDLTFNMVKVSGTVTVYFEDSVLLTKFYNGTPSSLSFTLTDGEKTYNFNMPNVKYTGAPKQVSGNGPISIALPFKALYDTTSGSSLVITKA